MMAEAIIREMCEGIDIEVIDAVGKFMLGINDGNPKSSFCVLKKRDLNLKKSCNL